MFFINRFPVCLNLFVFRFLVTTCLVVAVQPCMEWIPIKKKKSNIANSMMVFTFSFADQKYPFWANLVENIKSVCLSWNLMSRLLNNYAEYDGGFNFFCLRPKISFWGKFGPIFKIVYLKWILEHKVIWICRIQWWCPLFLF